jgi:hypothetical protein
MIIDASTPIAFSTGLNGGVQLEAVRHRLHGVRQVPVRAERLVAVKGSEAIAVRVAETVASAASGAPVDTRKNTPIRCGRPGGAFVHG